MAVFMDDPSLLTKERLKSELRAHNVELPGGNPAKDVYVQLYVKTVSAQSHGPQALDVFSSDEELPPPVVSRSRRSRSSAKKSEVVLEQWDMNEMSDEDLREQLLKHGVHAGPIVASTRKLYEKKLLKLLDNGAILLESQSHSNSGEAEVYSDQEEELPAAPEPDPTADSELEPEKNSSLCPALVQRHSINNSEVEKVTAEPPPSEEDPALSALNTASGLIASCRKPIKGAACRSVTRGATHSLENQTTVYSSAPNVSFTTSSSPSAASSAFSSESSASSAPPQAKEQGRSWWMKLLLVAVLLVFVVLLYPAMEPDGAEEL